MKKRKARVYYVVEWTDRSGFSWWTNKLDSESEAIEILNEHNRQGGQGGEVVKLRE